MNAAGMANSGSVCNYGYFSLFLSLFCELFLGLLNLNSTLWSLDDGGIHVSGRNIESFSNRTPVLGMRKTESQENGVFLRQRVFHL